MGEALMIAEVLEPFKAFNPHGETRLVGGAVRDIALGITPEDYDFTTVLLPEQVLEIAQKYGFHTVPVGIEHGTVRVITNKHTFEITTLREDIATNGRHAKVKFGSSFEQDALRRDFTINALSMDEAGEIYDYCGGLDDLKANRVRFIGDAGTRIREDYLRVLRFFRFSARFSPNLCDKMGLEAAIVHRQGLKNLSAERVQAELFKLLACENPYPILETMSNAGIFLELFGKVADFAPVEKPDPLLRLAALFLFKREDVQDLRTRLKLSNGDTRRLEMLSEGYYKARDLTQNQAKAMLYLCGKRGFEDRILIAQARFKQDYTHHLELLESFYIPTFPITGEELKAKGFVEGVEIGAEITRLKKIWLENGCAF
jgi:poly(A) polymerase